MAKSTEERHSGRSDDERTVDRAPGVAREPISEPRRSRPRRLRTIRPLIELTLYYAALIAVGALLIGYLPAFREAFVSPVALPAIGGAEDVLTGRAQGAFPARIPLDQVVHRSVTTFLVILGAMALIVPVARVYMQTKRLRYDPALVQSVVILPIVVAGIALVVKNSIALAFALAGIVAAVRFRNTLKDPRDAVYIFLVIGIGLSAGVQALDVALVVSMLFNYVVLLLWLFNIGSIYSGRIAETGVISAGDPSVMMAGTPENRREIRLRLFDEAEAMDDVDGVLLVHAIEPEVVRHTAQEALAEFAKEWRLARIVPRGRGSESLEYLVKLRKKATPAELIGTLTERWGEQLSAAEYFWLRARETPRDDVPDDDDDDD